MEPSIATFIMRRAAYERPLTEHVREGNGRCYTRPPIPAAPSPPVLPTLPRPSPPPSPATPTPSARDRPNPRHQQLAPSPPLFPDHWRTPSPCPPTHSCQPPRFPPRPPPPLRFLRAPVIATIPSLLQPLSLHSRRRPAAPNHPLPPASPPSTLNLILQSTRFLLCSALPDKPAWLAPGWRSSHGQLVAFRGPHRPKGSRMGHA